MPNPPGPSAYAPTSASTDDPIGGQLETKLRPELLDALTERERQVLARICRGESNAEIGRSLHISPDTARTYVSRLLAKLGVRDRAQLVVLSYESGLITPGST